jgi:hypothetical protein
METNVRHTGLIIPEGCRWCGVPFRDHPGLWVPSKGWHQWESPTPAQIRARIWARINKTIKDVKES